MLKKILEIMKRWQQGYKLADNLFILGGTKDYVNLLFNNQKIIVYMERLGGNPDRVIYSTYSQKLLKEENVLILEADFIMIIDLLKKHFEKLGEKVNLQ